MVSMNNDGSNSPRRRGTTLARAGALAAGGLLMCAGLMLGCAGHGYSSWPEVNNWDSAGDDMNVAPSPEAMATALKWAIRRYPPVANPELGHEYDEPLVINLPPMLRQNVAEDVLRRVGGRAQLATASNSGPDATLPIYHVSRVLIRGANAEVEIIRPVLTIGSNAGGTRLYQAIRLDLLGGFSPWRVTGHQSMAVGQASLPPVTLMENRADVAGFSPEERRAHEQRMRDQMPGSGTRHSTPTTAEPAQNEAPMEPRAVEPRAVDPAPAEPRAVDPQ
jgi:hypothetical protein